VTELADSLQDESCPPGVNSLGRTLTRWLEEIIALVPNWDLLAAVRPR
jgi:hypothetical protein